MRCFSTTEFNQIRIRVKGYGASLLEKKKHRLVFPRPRANFETVFARTRKHAEAWGGRVYVFFEDEKKYDVNRIVVRGGVHKGLERVTKGEIWLESPKRSVPACPKNLSSP